MTSDDDIFFQSAITCDAPPEQLAEHFRELLENADYVEAPEVYDPTGEYILARVYGDPSVGCSLQIYDQGASCLPIARTMAVLVGKEVLFHEVTVEGEPGKDKLDHKWARVMVVEVCPNGATRDVPPEAHIDEPLNGMDRYKASRRLLRGLVDPKIAKHPSEPIEIWMYREIEVFEEEEEEEQIQPRLKALIDDVAQALSVSMTEIGGQPALKLELPDGTRRFSVVSVQDLDIIRQATGVQV